MSGFSEDLSDGFLPPLPHGSLKQIRSTISSRYVKKCGKVSRASFNSFPGSHSARRKGPKPSGDGK